MKVRLPSNKWGLGSIDFRVPLIKDLRDIANSGYTPKQVIPEFVKMLIPGSTDLTKVSYWDCIYLYNIAAYSIHFNAIDVKLTCPKCKASIKRHIVLNDQDLVLFNQSGKYLTKIGGKSFEYRLPSMQDILIACDYASTQDDYDNSYWDALVSLILSDSKSFNKDRVSFVRELSHYQYVAALLYLQACYHGMEMFEGIKCEKCGNVFSLYTLADSSFIKFDVNDLMLSYAKISDRISFDNLLNLNVSEVRSFIKGFNESR